MHPKKARFSPNSGVTRNEAGRRGAVAERASKPRKPGPKPKVPHGSLVT
jgi:hypothetical protein